jgi:hypothetical protein
MTTNLINLHGSEMNYVPPGVVREVTMVDDAIVPHAVRW